MSATSPKYGLAVSAIAAMISSRRSATASASPATSSSRRPQRDAALSISWMSAPSWLRPDAMPPWAFPAPTHCVGAGGVDQQLLDRRRGGGLQGGHRGGADQDAVDRHQREAVGLRPATGQVLGGPLGGADAAADADA